MFSILSAAASSVISLQKRLENSQKTLPEVTCKAISNLIATSLVLNI